MDGSSNDKNSSGAAASNPIRWFWIAAGFVCVALGFVGAILPVMPSTVFFLMAAWCFARGSERWLNWLLALPTVGPLVRDFRAGKGMPVRAKIIAVSMLCFGVSLSIWQLQSMYPRVGVLVFGAVGAWFILTRIPTQVLAQAPARIQPEN